MATGRPRREQGTLETNLCRKSLFELRPGGQRQLALPLEGEDLLGLFRASGRLRATPDIDVLAWVLESWRRTREAQGWVRFTLHELGGDLYGRDPSGKDNLTMRASLRRLRGAQFDLVGYDKRRDEYGAKLCEFETLLASLSSELDRYGPDATKIGALRGFSFEVQLPRWLTRQIEEGNVTYLHFPTLRALDALAKRLWVYLEAERMKSGPHGTKGCWIKLGERVYAALGMSYKHDRQARAALKRAGERIVDVDSSYAEVDIGRVPGGWALFASKVVNREQWKAHRTILESLEAAR